MQRVQNYVRLLPAPGTLINAATVTVYLAGTQTLATIYSDNLHPNPTIKANPFTTNQYGGYFFYAPNGRYDVQASNGTPVLLTYVVGDVGVGLGDSGLPNYTLAALPASSLPNRGNVANLTDAYRGIVMDTGTQWVGQFGSVLNVKNFGATGNGVTDDTAAIQAAINAVPNNPDGYPAGEIFFPAGYYKVSSTLTMQAAAGKGFYITLRGANMGSTALSWAGGNNQTMLRVNPTAEIVTNFSATELMFDNRNFATGLTAIQFNPSAGGGTMLQTRVARCLFNNCNTGCRLYGEADEFTFQENHFIGGSYGIRLTGGGLLTVIANQFQNIAGPAVSSLTGSSKAFFLFSNVVQGVQTTQQAYVIDSFSALTILGLYVECGGSSPVVNPMVHLGPTAIGPSNFSGASIANCSFNYGNSGLGGSTAIKVDYAAGVSIGPNTFYKVDNGIVLTANASGVIVAPQNFLIGVTNQIVNNSPSALIQNVFSDGLTGVLAINLPVININGYGQLNIGSFQTATLFAASAPSTWIVTITQGVEKYSTVGVVTVPLGSATAEVATLSATSGSLALAVSGLNVQAVQGLAGVRTVSYRAIRIA